MLRSKTGELTVYRPDRRRFDHQPTTIDNPGDLETQNRCHGLTINHQTHRCHWQGRGPNISDIIYHLDLCHTRHTNNQPPTSPPHTSQTTSRDPIGHARRDRRH